MSNSIGRLPLLAGVVIVLGALVSPASAATITLSSLLVDLQATDQSLVVWADSLISTDVSILGTDQGVLGVERLQLSSTDEKKLTKSVPEPESLLLVSVAFAGVLLYKRLRGWRLLNAERR